MSRGSFIGGGQKIEDLKGTFLVDKAGNYIAGKSEDYVVGKDSIALVEPLQIFARGNTGRVTSSGTTHPITLPTRKNGDLLLLLFATDGSSSSTHALDNPTWTQLRTFTVNSHRSAIFYKISDGNDALTITTNFNNVSAHNVYVSNATGIITSSQSNGNVTLPNPPNLNTSNNRKYIWIAYVSNRGTRDFTQIPYGFKQKLYNLGSSALSLTSCEVISTQISLDPDVFSPAPSTRWVAWTIALYKE